MKQLHIHILLFVLAFFVSTLSLAQIDVVNTGTLITIQKNATFYINGNYTDVSALDIDSGEDFGKDPERDNGTATAPTLDAPIFLSGKLYISGDIINDARFGTALIYRFEEAGLSGEVIFNGTGDQMIGGDHSTYFPNLTINNSSATRLDRSILLDNKLTLASGSVDLNANDIFLGQHGLIVDESATNSIGGTSGQVLTSKFEISAPDLVTNDYRGLGLGYDATGENPTDVFFERIHRNASTYIVANGVYVLREYKVKTSTTLATLSQVFFKYHDTELNGLTESASNLALYVSNDGGTSWTKMSSSVNTTTNVVTADNVPIVDTSGGADNIFVLAASNCVATYNPSTVISSTNSEVISSGNMNICDGNDLAIQVASNDASYYQWSTPSGIVGTQGISQAPISFAGEGNYVVAVRNNRGCENTSTLAVNVRDIPVASFDITPDPQISKICLGTELTFSDATSVIEGPITKWEWDYGDTNLGPNNGTPTYTYATYGLYNPQLTVESTYGCRSNTAVWDTDIATEELRVESLPVPSFEMRDDIHPAGSVITELCEDFPVYFHNQSTYSDYTGSDETANLTYDWSFGPALAVSTDVDPNYTYEDYGIYTVNLTAIAPVSGCSVITSQVITIDPEPRPEFSFKVDGSDVTEACTGEYILFDNTSSIPDASAITYTWTFNDGTTSTEVSPSKQYVTPGLYTIWLDAYSSEHGCSESTSFDITINPPPTGDFDISHQDICVNGGVTFANNSVIATPGTLSFDWDFGDGTSSTSSAATVNHTYIEAGMYEVTLLRTSDKGCDNTVSGTITVHPDPVPNFVFSNTCDGIAVQFSNSSSIQSDNITSYLWDFGDGNTSTDESPSHTYSTYGDYDVTLTATSDFTCSDITSPAKVISIYQNPSFDLGGAIVACATDYTLDPLTDAGAYLPAGTTFEWTDSEGNIIANTNSITVNQPDTYVATITSAAPEVCETVVNTPLFLFQPANLGGDLNVCEQVILDAEYGISPSQKALATNTTYQWWKDGVPISTDQTLVVTETAQYTIQITREVHAQSCASSDDINVAVVTTPPVVNLPTQYSACDGESVTMTSDITGDSYSWIDLSTGLEVANAISHTTNLTGDYRLIVTNGACTTEDETTVVFYSIPSVSYSVNSVSICLGETFEFEDLSFVSDGVMTSNNWDFGDGAAVSNQPVPSKSYATSGDYTVVLTAISSNGCSDVFSQLITVKELPIVDFSLTPACTGEVIGIVNNSTLGADLSWDFGDGTTDNVSSPSKVYNEAGTYSITLTADLNGCEVSATRLVTIHEVPELDLGGAITTCGTSLTLDAGNSGATYRWYDPGSGTDLAVSQQYTVTSNGMIGVEITNAQGCITSDEVDITLNTPVSIDLGVDRIVCDAEILDAGFFSGGSYAWSTGETTRTIEVVSTGTYAVSVVDQNGCTESSSVMITVNETPVIELGNDVEACEGELIVLDPGFDPSYTYLWSTGAVTPTIEVSTSSNYDVVVSNATCTMADNINVTIRAVPVADFTGSDVCAGQLVLFDNLSTYGGAGTLSYLWTFGDGTSSALENPEKLYNIPGVYTATLITTSSEGCSHQVSRTINVGYVPHTNFSLVEGCQDDIYVFTNTTSYTGSELLTYSWDFGDGEISSEESPQHTYPVSGSYFVILSVNSALGCSDSFTREIYVGEKPELSNWENSISTCNGSLVLDAQNSGSTYIWSNNTTGQSLEVTESGNYTVEITSIDGCSIIGEVAVQIYDQVLLDLTDAVEDCGEVVLDPGFNGSNASYLWSSGERTNSLKVIDTDTYWVEVVSSDLCIGRDTTSVVVRPVPEIDLGADTELCVGEVMSLDATSALPVTYLWSTGEVSPSIQTTQSDTYTVMLTTEHGCVYEDSIELIFHDLPIAPLDDEVTGCDEVILDALNIFDDYLWSTGATSRTISVTESGDYSVTITNDYGCVTEDLSNVAIFASPELDLGDDITLCDGETTELDAGTTADNYLWSDNSTNRVIEVGATNTYGVTITNEQGCSTYDEVVVTVRDPLDLDLGEDQLLCSNASIYFNAGVSDVSYDWGSDTGFTSTDREVRPTETGRYWITIEDNFGCIESDTILITPTNQGIEANFLLPSVVGVGDRVHFAQLSEPDPVSFNWTFGDGGFSTEENPSHRYFTEGEYAPTLVVSNGICTDTLTKSLTVRNARFEGEFDQLLPEFIEILDASLYPNPAQDLVQLDLKLTAETEVIVHIYTINGYLVEERKVHLEDAELEFDLTGKEEGLYLIKIIAGDKTSTLKLLKAGGTR